MKTNEVMPQENLDFLLNTITQNNVDLDVFIAETPTLTCSVANKTVGMKTVLADTLSEFISTVVESGYNSIYLYNIEFLNILPVGKCVFKIRYNTRESELVSDEIIDLLNCISKFSIDPLTLLKFTKNKYAKTKNFVNYISKWNYNENK